MNIRVTEHKDFLTLSIDGRLDISTATELKNEVVARLSSGFRMIILNMAQVDFINSSGLGTLVSILKDVRAAEGRLVLSNLASYVHEIFEITQLIEIFEIFPVEAEAQQALSAAGKSGVQA
jgi:anti-sigma B factor antagonist